MSYAKNNAIDCSLAIFLPSYKLGCRIALSKACIRFAIKCILYNGLFEAKNILHILGEQANSCNKGLN